MLTFEQTRAGDNFVARRSTNWRAEYLSNALVPRTTRCPVAVVKPGFRQTCFYAAKYIFVIFTVKMAV